MKKLAVAMMAIGSLLLVGGSVSKADYPPGSIAFLQRLPAAGAPGIQVRARVQNCMPGESIPFTLATSTTQGVCNNSGQTQWVEFTAPRRPGSYLMTAVLGEGVGPNEVSAGGVGGAVFGLLFPQAEKTPVRPRTLTVRFLVVPEVAARTAARMDAVQTAPTIDPADQLPATGSSTLGSSTAMAISLLVVGFGMFTVAQIRRRRHS
jgi:hypothetical protein